MLPAPLLLAALTLSPTLVVARQVSAAALPPTPAPVRLLDLDGDGRLDKLHLDLAGLRVSLNRGGGVFESVQQRLPAADVVHALAGDLDGDGRLDLYLVTPGDNLALHGLGAGAFEEATATLGLTDGGHGRSAERVDLDGDGDDDLLLHNARGDVIFWSTGAGFLRDADTPERAPASDPGAPALSAELQEILGHLSLIYLDDGSGQRVAKTIRVSGVNLQLVNGLRATNGNPQDPDALLPESTAVNGVGNLIVGYNELGNPLGDDRTGSHNLVVGSALSYSSFGGVVVGSENTIAAPFATVTGGFQNRATGVQSAVGGGTMNRALGTWSSVSGGRDGTASGFSSAVSGGLANEASGSSTSVTGGIFNQASGFGAAVTGGWDNRAPGGSGTVVGGRDNQAQGATSVVGGGFQRVATGEHDFVAGSLVEDL